MQPIVALVQIKLCERLELRIEHLHRAVDARGDDLEERPRSIPFLRGGGGTLWKDVGHTDRRHGSLERGVKGADLALSPRDDADSAVSHADYELVAGDDLLAGIAEGDLQRQCGRAEDVYLLHSRAEGAGLGGELALEGLEEESLEVTHAGLQDADSCEHLGKGRGALSSLRREEEEGGEGLVKVEKVEREEWEEVG
jgi:hypothetical protein